MTVRRYVEDVLGRLRREPTLEAYIRRGMEVGVGVEVNPGATFDWPHCWLISIGDDCVFAPGVRVLAHDASMKAHLGFTKVGRVVIGDRTFVGANAVVMPNVRIGRDVIIGAGSVVTRDVDDGLVVAGNPATPVQTTEEFLARHRQNREVNPTWSYNGWSSERGITEDRKAAMREALAASFGYIE